MVTDSCRLQQFSGCAALPEVATAGLWSTPGDLAKLLIAIQRGLEGRGPVPREAAERLVDLIQDAPEEYSQSMPAIASREILQHGSRVLGSVLFVAHRSEGYGAVLMSNSHQAGPLLREILATIAFEYGWAAIAPEPMAAYELGPEERQRFVGRYSFDGFRVVEITLRDGKLRGHEALGHEEMQLILVGPTRILVPDLSSELRFDVDDDGAIVGFRPEDPEFHDSFWKRLGDDEVELVELLGAGRVDEAVEHLRSAGRLEPGTLNDHGYRLLIHGRVEEALVVFRKNVKLYPERAGPLDSLSDALVKNGDLDEAERVLVALLEKLQVGTVESEKKRDQMWKLGFGRLDRIAALRRLEAEKSSER